MNGTETQSIKELVAWGGLDDAESKDPDTTWPVDPCGQKFILEGYVRGWGLTGAAVDVD